jgi:hypothetical protein
MAIQARMATKVLPETKVYLVFRVLLEIKAYLVFRAIPAQMAILDPTETPVLMGILARMGILPAVVHREYFQRHRQQR